MASPPASPEVKPTKAAAIQCDHCDADFTANTEAVCGTCLYFAEDELREQRDGWENAILDCERGIISFAELVTEVRAVRFRR